MWSADRPTVSSSCTTRSSMARGPSASLWITRPSPTMAATVMRGFRLANGSWKMICMSRARPRSSCGPIAPTSRPSNSTSPAVGSISRSTQRPVVLLPQPDSPTTPSVSPAASSKLTPSTACTWSTTRRSTPPRIGKCFFRSLTCSSGGCSCSRSRMQATRWPGATSRSGGVAWRHSARDMLAARGEAAAFGRVDQLGHGAGDGLQPLPVRAARSMRGIERISPCV